jgi:S1-C subfamily serine protease
MKLESAQQLKQQLLRDIVVPFTVGANKLRTAAAVTRFRAMLRMAGEVTPFGVGARPFETLPHVQRSIALGLAPHSNGYRLAIRLQRPSLRNSSLVEHVTRRARGEVDMRIVGRIDKRTKKLAALPWYQRNTRPLLIGASVGHVKITAGTLSGFVKRASAVYLLSNNHVLANEDRAKSGDWIIQRARFDGGKHPADDVARLKYWIRLKKSETNFVDAALGAIEQGITYNANVLTGLVNGKDRKLAGIGPEFIDEGDVVYKVGRTTGATKGRVTAFDLDNVVINYDIGNLRFDGQIEIEGTGQGPFSDGGDSGSLIVNADMQAIALLFAGSDSGGRNNLGLTYANPIHRVLKDLKASLLL